MRAQRIVIAGAVAVGLVLSSGGFAQAAPPAPPAPGQVAGALPPGWEITGSKLTWHARDRVPMGDAAVEFYAGDRLLGRPIAGRDGRTFQLDLASVRLDDLSALQVRAGGRRLDATGAAPRSRAAAPITPPAAAPKSQLDPGTPGPYRTVTGEYTLPSVKLPDFPEPVEMVGVVVAPVPEAPGRRPLALFLHGRHYTCFSGPGEEDATGGWPCAEGWQPIPSYRGYLQAQRLLASQGYVTVSISANGINGQDWEANDGGAQARSSLVRLHLARWAGWAGASRAEAPAIVRTAPRADLSRVLLVGHSRGGEGVNRAAMDSLSRPPAELDGYHGPVTWRIRGTVLIGPTIFGHNPAPDVPSLTILPGCDGDVSDLQGQIYVDGTRRVSRGAALHSAAYMIGANHNFFNTEWTPGQAVAPASDDYGSEGDPLCSPGTATRLTYTQQQQAGATYIATAARLFVRGDDRARPLLDGGGVRAPSADPARVLSHAIGAARTPLLVPDPSVAVTGSGARLCAQVHPDPEVACLGEELFSPHFVSFGGISEPDRHAVALDWSAPGTPVGLRPARPVSVAGAQSLALRVVVPPNSTGTRLDVAVTDGAGRRAVLGEVRLDGLPGTEYSTSHWGQEVRVPLAAAVQAGVDLRRIAALELVPRSDSGQAWLIDAWGWRAGTPAPRPVELPRVDIGQLTVDEGDSGVRTYRVPVTYSGKGSGQVRFYQVDPETGDVTHEVVTVRPGAQTVEFPVEVRGNTRFGNDDFRFIVAKTVQGATVGNYVGGVAVLNDDPMPEITVAPVADRVTEGQALTWRVTLSAEADAGIWADFPLLPPTAGPELSTTDVDPEWLDWMFGTPPLPSRPLSSLEFGLFVLVEPGELTADITVPTIVDGVAEPDEHLRAQLVTYPPDGDEPVIGPELTGTVVDHP